MRNLLSVFVRYTLGSPLAFALPHVLPPARPLPLLLRPGSLEPGSLDRSRAPARIHTLACTDTNGVWGAVEFQREAESAGLRPILGVHLVWENEEAVVLAEDDAGWGEDLSDH